MNAPLEKSLLDTLKAPHFPIYMDYSATTPVDPRVADKMIPYLREQFGNPGVAQPHVWLGAQKKRWKRRAGMSPRWSMPIRAKSSGLRAPPKATIWRIKGAAQFYKTKGKHIITVKTEHKAVLDVVRELERQGFEATYLQTAG